MAKYIPCDGPDCPNAPTVIMTFITEGRTVYYCDEHYAGLIIEMAAFMAGDDEEPLFTEEALAELRADTGGQTIQDLIPEEMVAWSSDDEPDTHPEPEAEPEGEPGQ